MMVAVTATGTAIEHPLVDGTTAIVTMEVAGMSDEMNVATVTLEADQRVCVPLWIQCRRQSTSLPLCRRLLLSFPLP
jgi:hypothetical protein